MSLKLKPGRRSSVIAGVVSLCSPTLPAHALARRFAALALAAAASGVAAQPTLTPYNITFLDTSVLNDLIGNSRFFAGPNTSRVRVSAFVVPSPDSDFFVGINSTGQQFISTNGAGTQVFVTNPFMGTLTAPRQLTWVGLLSGRGGVRNEYTTTFDRANAAVAPLLDAWAANPFQIRATNPVTFNGPTSVTVTAPSFDRGALPPFVTDLRVSGGLSPTLTWRVPPGTAANRASLQIRLVQGESADGSRITRATLVHSDGNLPVAADMSYTITTLNNAALLELPTTLQIGSKYEVSVQLDIVAGGELKGRSRTFFEYTPLNNTSSNVAVYLPSVGTNGAFKFDVTVDAGQTYDIDPETAVGYIYETGAGDPSFRNVALPNVGDGRYTIEVFDPALGRYNQGFSANAGTSYDFVAMGYGQGVAKFRVKGIEASAGLDSTNTTAFITTVGFTGAGRFTGTMKPVTGYTTGGFASPVNLPPTPTTTRAGATLPLKWTLADREGDAATDLSAVASVVYKPTSCAAFATDAAGGTAAESTGGSSLRYDWSAAQYVFNWKTPATPGCYSLFVTTDTAQTIRAHVVLTQ